MMRPIRRTLVLFFAFLFIFSNAQNSSKNWTAPDHSALFRSAYQAYPLVPKGVLEAWAWHNTRLQPLNGNEAESCLGLPRCYGIMGLVPDGKGYFRNNLSSILQFSNRDSLTILQNQEEQVLACAEAWTNLQTLMRSGLDSRSFSQEEEIAKIFAYFSEIPDTGYVNQFALNSQLYVMFSFLNDPDNSITYNFPNYQFNLESIFGRDNYRVLSSPKVEIGANGIRCSTGELFSPSVSTVRSPDYAPALYTPAPSCNYSSRSGTPVSAITVHTIQGSYAGAISWAQNCNSNVSYHYVIRSSDGQVTQMVLESIKAWHVGSENPYTIGYEHEGYVSQTGWYTQAMYNASANLSRDVCNSGYGINPLRTYYGASSSGINVLGSCTRIKGHQHYPNQTHTDPGINWDWEKYYQLINNSPTQTTLSSATGNFYDSGGQSANYTDDERYTTLIAPAGATQVSLNFSSFNLENNWDFMYIYDGNSVSSPLIGIYTGTNSPGTVTSSGGALLIEFRSDCSTTAAGWAASWTSNAIPPQPTDNTPPSTIVSTLPGWVTQDFTATFTDADNSGGSGLEKAFYQVIDFDGADWRANANRGFFSDNFDLATIHPEWTSVSGTWAINNGTLEQNDQSNGNTNIYAFVDHSLSNRYLYHWAGKIKGIGTNRRAGLHYFCDQPSLTNRGNSYFVWFRLDNAKIQLYKVVNDVFTLEDEVPYTFTANQWYDFKVIYDRILGKHQVYVNNSLVQTWIDSSPYSTGNYVSFRSGDAQYAVDNFKIYRSRLPSVTITVGSGGDLRYQSQNPSTAAGRIKSIVIDSAGNLSPIHFQDVKVDWTIPNIIPSINDGSATDIDTTYNNTELEANWSPSSDPHSGITAYYYAIGTSPGGTDLVNWTSNNWYDSVRVTGLNLNYNTTYYFSVKAINGAGLESLVSTSDGQLLVIPFQPPTAGFIVPNTFICQGTPLNFQNTSSNASSYIWSFPGGTPSGSTSSNPSVVFPSTGSYLVQLIAAGPGGTDTLTQTINVDVSLPIVADFIASDTLVYLPNALVGFTNNSQNANGYSWSFGDGGTSNGNNPWHQYQSTGLFTVQLVAINNACPNDTSSTLVHVQGTNGWDEVTNEVFIHTIGTEPLTLLVNSDSNPIQKIELIDLNGKIIHSLNGNNRSGQQIISFPSAKYSKGIYLVRIQSDKGNFHHKVVLP